MSIEGITVVLPKTIKQYGFGCAAGTKFYTKDGKEIKGVTKFSMPDTSSNDAVSISLTFALSDIKFSEE